MSIEGSEVAIEYDETTDIAAHAVITQATFDTAAHAAPSTCEIHLRDPDQILSFVTGRRLRLKIDGQYLWSGFSRVNGRSSFFPAGDGLESTKARKFILRGVDNNILLDKRVLHNPASYLTHIPHVTSDVMDGELIREALADYVDSLGAGFDVATHIDDVMVPAGGDITASEPWAWPEQGSYLRALFEDLARWSAAVYYIGPDDAVHYHALQTVECPWGFSDKPNHAPIIGSGGFEGAYWGFREITADEDGSEFATDAFVWGGSPFAGAGGTVFKRSTDAALEAIHNKWQRAEVHFGETNFKTQKTVDQRANMIVFGNPDGTPGGSEPGSVVGEGPRGLRFPQWAYNLTWHTKDVPDLAGTPRHLYPGDIVPIQLWAFSQDEGATPFSKFLPLRAVRISFPSGAKNGKAHVQFQGGFDLRNEDSKFLWRYLRRRSSPVASVTLAVVTEASTSAQHGAFGQFPLTPAPDGVNTVFTLSPFGYIPGTANVFVNGSLRTPGVGATQYSESDPETGEVTFVTAPLVTDELYGTCRTLAG